MSVCRGVGGQRRPHVHHLLLKAGLQRGPNCRAVAESALGKQWLNIVQLQRDVRVLKQMGVKVAGSHTQQGSDLQASCELSGQCLPV